MPVTFLTLPREIRDLIVIGILRSHTGFIVLLPTHRTQHPRWDAAEQPSRPKFRIIAAFVDAEYSTDKHLEENQIISLSLLLTCGQLNAECKGLLWKYNTLVMIPRRFLRDCKYLPDHVQLQIQHVCIHFDMLEIDYWDERYMTQYSGLKKLEAWKKDGALAAVTITLARPRETFQGSWEVIGRFLVRRNLDMLRAFARHGSILAGVERRVVLEGEAVVPFNEGMDNLGGPDEVLRKAGEAFDAEVWVDGKLEWAWVEVDDDSELSPSG